MTFKKLILISASVVLPAFLLIVIANTKLELVKAHADVGSTNGYTNNLGNDLGMFYVNVNPSSYYVAQGGTVSFTGSHFYPGETVTITNNGTTVGSVVADGAGNISTPGYMVSYAGGNQPYTLVGNMSNIPYTVNLAVRNSNAWAILTSYYAGQGSSIGVVGHAFGSNEMVSLWFDGMNMGTATADVTGDVSLSMTVPAGAMGHHMITLKGEKTGITADAHFTQAF